MNKQLKRNRDGILKSRGIEWVGGILPDGVLLENGYTSNPVAGCHYGCRWNMPDGSTAICYAERIAEKLAKSAYPGGFAPVDVAGEKDFYWNPKELNAWERKKEPSEIFVGSQADVFGPWVDEHYVKAILQAMAENIHHRFYTLTKNPSRLWKYDFSPNVWVGASVPPSMMMGKALDGYTQQRMLERTVYLLAQTRAKVRWLSIEPLSWDVAPVLADALAEQPEAIQWAVIGAATNGPKKYQPRHEWMHNLLLVFDQYQIPVFFKGNIKWDVWREEKPSGSFSWKGQGYFFDAAGAKPLAYAEKMF